jgi:hypothetical protein
MDYGYPSGDELLRDVLDRCIRAERNDHAVLEHFPF